MDQDNSGLICFSELCALLRRMDFKARHELLLCFNHYVMFIIILRRAPQIMIVF